MRVEITITDDRSASDDANEWQNGIRLYGWVDVDPSSLLDLHPSELFTLLLKTAREWSPE